MSRTDAKLIREHLESIRGWIKHWDNDRICKLVPTASSLVYAKHHADSALGMLDRYENLTCDPGNTGLPDLSDRAIAMLKDKQ